MSESSRPVGEQLSLREALVSFCDPALIDGVRREERRLSLHEHRQTRMPVLGAISDLREPGQYDWMGAGSSHSTFFAAWDQLLTDFRSRIERQALSLIGVQLAPLPTTRAEALPGKWTSQFQFDFDRNVIAMGEKRWGAIGVSTVTVIAATRTARSVPDTEQEPAAVKRRRGRPSLGRTRLIAIAARIPRAGSNKEIAKQLIEEFSRLHADRPPAFATVMSHVASIYEAAAASASSLKTQK